MQKDGDSVKIKRIKIANFKSFKDLDIELGKFNVIIGPNASGKSNFVCILEFFRDIINFGLDNAISLQGGVEYLRNINIGGSEQLCTQIVTNQGIGFGRQIKDGLIGVKPHKTIFEFALKFNQRGSGFKVVEDKFVQEYIFVELQKKEKKVEEKKILGKGELIVFYSNGKEDTKYKIPPEVPLNKEDASRFFFPFFSIFSPFILKKTGDTFKLSSLFPQKNIRKYVYLERLHYIVPSLKNISIYNFDPKSSKKGTPITGKAELEENGSNLALVLKNILKNKEKRKKFLNLIQDCLPFIKNVDVEKFADKSLLFKLQEKYYKQYLPASLISDGTINIAALIIALYFEKKHIVVFEEPERYIHPYLISKIVDMMKVASQNKQIIVTTHNPEIVRHAGLENILLIYRDKDGFSKISRPIDKEEIKIFLKNNIGIEELYIQNLL